MVEIQQVFAHVVEHQQNPGSEALGPRGGEGCAEYVYFSRAAICIPYPLTFGGLFTGADEIRTLLTWKGVVAQLEATVGL